jgi:hypothetical protein
MKVGPAAIGVEWTPPNVGTPLSTELDPIPSDDLTNGVRLFDHLDVNALCAA